MNKISIKSESELLNAAKEFISQNEKNKIFAFYGKMGAGKTTFIKEICKYLGSTDTITSPTFAIVNEYNSTLYGKIFHFDFYRVEKQEEVYDLGYEEYLFNNNYCLIEWPERIENLLPPETIKVTIAENNDKSRIITWY